MPIKEYHRTMTEQEWLSFRSARKLLCGLLYEGDGPYQIGDIGKLKRRVIPLISDRKMRLFACACAWTIGGVRQNFWTRGTHWQTFLRSVEESADGIFPMPGGTEWVVAGQAHDAALAATVVIDARVATRFLREIVGNPFQRRWPPTTEVACPTCQSAIKARIDELMSGGLLGDGIGAHKASRQINDEFGTKLTGHEVYELWEIGKAWGNPCKICKDSGVIHQCNPTVFGMATEIYQQRDWALMPILADACEDAGCNDEAILDHLRDKKAKHCRGCWALDLLLGKE